MVQPHILLVTYPAQGHINPAIQLAKRLVGIGVMVTVATCESTLRRMSMAANIPLELNFAGFSDGYEDGLKPGDDIVLYMSELRRVGSLTLSLLISKQNCTNNVFTCVVYSILIPWVAKVAREAHLPSTLFWNQPVTVMDIYYYYFNGYREMITNNVHDPNFSVSIPGLPELGIRDLPSFCVSEDVYPFALPLMKEQFEVLDEETEPRVIVNTFDKLEFEALKSIKKYNVVGIGPLLPSAFLDGKDPSDKSFGADLFKGTNDYVKWLNSKSEKSVIYISFGSISVLSGPQKEEIACALVELGKPFLWVIRGTGGETEQTEELSCREEMDKLGMIVPWCSQVEVLSHPSVGCFMTHCGWNSTLESIASGVPMVSFPQWTDQFTNAKLVEDVWKVGVRVVRIGKGGDDHHEEGNEKGLVKSGEIKRCLELVMGDGERGVEMSRNALKLKGMAREAVHEGGSSDINLKAFVHEIGLLG